VISSGKASPRLDHPITRSPDRQIRRRLLRWFDQEKRRLPWRGTRDPYRIWVSEVMLQQTTVTAVRGRYEPFLQRFPGVASLARASEEQVLAAWSGLGYYGRARNLRRTARILCREHGGRLPRDPAALRKLPGFGPYTAAAVSALAWEEPAAAADANVTRVLSRLFALPGLAGSRMHREAVLGLAEQLMPRDRPGDFTAALMDLGQLVCTPRLPACPRCPLAPECAAWRNGRPESYPVRKPKARPLRVSVAAADARSGGRTLLIRREGTLLSGMWAYPSADGRTPAEARRRLARALAAHGLRIERTAPFARATHTVVNRQLTIDVYRAAPNPKRVRRSAQREGGSKIQDLKSSRWFRPQDLARAAVPTLTRKIAIAAGFLRR
jgi:A/G-specific adenine glycosylase